MIVIAYSKVRVHGACALFAPGTTDACSSYMILSLGYK